MNDTKMRAALLRFAAVLCGAFAAYAYAAHRGNSHSGRDYAMHGIVGAALADIFVLDPRQGAALFALAALYQTVQELSEALRNSPDYNYDSHKQIEAYAIGAYVVFFFHSSRRFLQRAPAAQSQANKVVLL